MAVMQAHIRASYTLLHSPKAEGESFTGLPLLPVKNVDFDYGYLNAYRVTLTHFVSSEVRQLIQNLSQVFRFFLLSHKLYNLRIHLLLTPTHCLVKPYHEFS
jgi:hypothetical protein